MTQKHDFDAAPVWTEADIGCYVDGGYGPDHSVDVLAGMLDALQADLRARDLYAEVNATGWDREDLDTVTAWLDEATSVLQSYTADGLVWIWDAGDLILTTQEEAV